MSRFENVAPYIRVPFRYGLLGGLIGCVAVFVLFKIGKHPFLLPVVADFRILMFAVLIFFSLKEVRDYYQDGILYFWQGTIGSYVLVTTSGVIGSVFVWCLAKWSETFLSSYISFLNTQLTDYKAKFIENVGKEAYEQQLAKLPLTSPGDMAMDYFLKSIFISLFLIIILTVILRRTPKTI